MKRKNKKNKYYIPLTLLMLVAVVAVLMISSSTVSEQQSTTSKRKPQTTQHTKQPTKPQTTRPSNDKTNQQSIELPAHQPNDSLITSTQGRYTLQYSPHYRSAIWVAYKLTYSDTQGKSGRSSTFRPDSILLKRGYAVATNKDYSKSGYDKGHLLPSADRQSSQAENRATFLLSNCSPQLPALNRGTWKRLEEHVRKMSHQYDTLYIVTGALLRPHNKRLGKNCITIAGHYFKAILARRGDSFTASGYIMPNNVAISDDIERYSVSIDSIERTSGLDLYPQIRIP